MDWILFIIILAIGYALCGATSGIKAISKCILYIALFLGIGWIIVEIPWLLILVVIGIIILRELDSNSIIALIIVLLITFIKLLNNIMTVYTKWLIHSSTLVTV